MSVSLSKLLSRMDIWTPIYNKSEVLKVNAIDQALRTLRRTINPPWTLQKSTLRIFDDVLEYPTASDHAQLAFLNDQRDEGFGNHPRYVYSSIKDFYEDPTNRNQLAEIWKGGTMFLGVRNKTDDNMSSTTVDTAESDDNYTSSGDAGTVAEDTVVFKKGNGSIRVPITSSTGTAGVQATFTSMTDTNYKRKYYFRWVYLDAVPTSLTLRFGADSSNYFYETVTAQFSGASFVADDWNLVAFDLNGASETGSPSSTFAWHEMVFTGASTGTYYLDEANMRGWVLEDYWYYSNNNIVDSTGATPAAYFAPDGSTYTSTDELYGDDIWADVVLYEGALYLLADDKEQVLSQSVSGLRNDAMRALMQQYPDLSPHIITNTYRFLTDYPMDSSDPYYT